MEDLHHIGTTRFNRHAMKPLYLLLITLIILPVTAEDAKATDFIRMNREAESVQLQTAMTRYQKMGMTVDLIGAIHIADAKYFDRLNLEFKQYESVLFEMIGGENLNHGKQSAKPAKVKDPAMSMLGNVYAMVSQFLKLQSQKEGVDYTVKNMVHADLTLREFEKLQAEKGESLIGFAMQNVEQAQKNGGKGLPAMDSKKLMMAVLSGDANMLKRELVLTLGQGDDQVAAFAGDTVIIGDRNAKCLKVLDAQAAAGKNKVGIFYGAAHFPDMEKRMLKAGYQKMNQRWLTAWDIPGK
jgi:arsenate reductase-like glutaredoxin family protein